MSQFLFPNNSYNASLTADYTAGDSTLSVNTIPTNFPTLVTVARGTTKETRFTVTGGASGLLTGVTRLDGATENISAGVSVECMIDAEYITQLEAAVFTQLGLKQLLYAADGGSNDTYAITLAVAPASYTDILGLPITFKANTANTGAATLNVNSLGAKTIKKNGNDTLDDDDIQAGQIVTVAYDGTDFQIQGSVVSIDTDGTLADNSDTKIPSQKAVKTYVDTNGADVTILTRSTTQIPVTNTTTETDVFSYSVPGNTLSTNKWLRLTMLGQYTNNTGVAKTLSMKLKYGATTLVTTTRATNADAGAQHFTLEAYIAANGGTSAQKGGFSVVGVNTNVTFNNGGYGTATEDSTATKTLALTVTHETASSSLTFNAEAAILELLS